MAEPIAITSLTKTYPGGTVPALRSVSLDVAPGSFLVLLGPSGSGKTTLVRCLAGIERIDSGSVSIGSRLVTDGRTHLPPEQRDLSMVFQDYALWPHLTALDNVAFALRRRRLGRAQCRAGAMEMLSRVDLGRVRRALPERAVRRAAAAGRAGAGADRGHRADPVRRAAVQPGRRPARADARGDLVPGPRGRRDHRLHHPRPGRGVRARRRDRGARIRGAGAVGLARGCLPPPGDPVRGAVHRAGPRAAGPRHRPRRRRPARAQRGLRCRRGAAALRLRPAGLAAAAGSRLKPGDDALLAIRATGIYLLRSAEETPHLSGRVADVAFRGRGYEYAIDLPGLGRLTGVFARHRADRGDPAGLRLDPEGCHLFPAEAPNSANSPAPALIA